jgi:hypothetical protein
MRLVTIFRDRLITVVKAISDLSPIGEDVPKLVNDDAHLV